MPQHQDESMLALAELLHQHPLGMSENTEPFFHLFCNTVIHRSIWSNRSSVNREATIVEHLLKDMLVVYLLHGSEINS